MADMTAIAAQIQPEDSHLDLHNAAQLADIIRSAASRLGVALGSDVVQAAATAVAAVNQAIYAVPLSTGLGFVEALTRIESAAQGAVAAKLSALGAGHLSPAD